MTAELGLAAIDREVARAVRESEGWDRSLRELDAEGGGPKEGPLARFRSVSGRTAFQSLLPHEKDVRDPLLRDALRRWVGMLTVLRITEPDRAEEASRLAAPTLLVKLETENMVSPRAAVRGLVASKRREEADAWLSAIARGGPSLAAVRRERAAREEEVARQLGCESVSDVIGGPSPSVVEGYAQVFLDETRDLAASLRREKIQRGEVVTPGSEIVDACAHKAGEGWPAKLSLRTVVATLKAPSDIGRGLTVDARVPRSLGAASFARALVAFGAGYRRAAAVASRQPFACAVPPYFVDAHRFGFAFGSLATTRVYGEQGLGLSARVAALQARMLSATALLHTRSIAMTALLARSPDRLEELSSDVFGAPLARGLSGAFPGGQYDSARVLALFTTLPFLHRLRDLWDEQWWRSPHAWAFLRGRGAVPGFLPAEDEPDPRALARALERQLG
jgi:hypothetical protein